MDAATIVNQASLSYTNMRRTPRVRFLVGEDISTGAGKKVLTLPRGGTYHEFLLRFTIAGAASTQANIVAMIGETNLVVDTDVKIRMTAAEHVMRADFYRGNLVPSGPVFAGVLPIPLWHQNNNEIAGQDGPAYGTLDVGSIQLDLTTLTGSTIDRVEVFAVVSDPTRLGRHICVRPLDLSFASTGICSVSTEFPTKNPLVNMQAMHISKAAGAAGPITDFTLETEFGPEWEGKPEFLDSYVRRLGLKPQTGWFHLPFSGKGRPQEGLIMSMNQLRLKMTCSAALNAYRILMELAEGVDG